MLTHAHRPELASSDEKYKDEVAPDGSPFRPLYDEKIRFSGQPVALVLAEELEIARFAASLVRIEYERAAACHRLRSRAQARRSLQPARMRRPTAAAMPRRRSSRRPFASRPSTACRSSTTIRWSRSRPPPCGKVTAGSPSTTRPRDRRTAVTMSPTCAGCRRDKVRVLCPYVGGAFGSGLRPQYQLPLAVLAARALQRSVRVTLTRQQMFTLGYRAGIVHDAGARGGQRRDSFSPSGTTPSR